MRGPASVTKNPERVEKWSLAFFFSPLRRRKATLEGIASQPAWRIDCLLAKRYSNTLRSNIRLFLGKGSAPVLFAQSDAVEKQENSRESQ